MILRKFYGILGLTLLLVMTSFTEQSKPIALDQCYLENKSFAGGEKLIYKMYYNYGLLWIPAGEVTFTVQESKDDYELKAIGRTYKSYESLFKVNDYFYSKVDKNSLRPKNFVRIVEEGNYRLYDSISFDQNKNIAVTFQGKTKSDAKCID